MVIITISGEAGSGKDTFAEILRSNLRKSDLTSAIYHYADPVKDIASKYYNWDGNKDVVGRTILQLIGTDVGRTKNAGIWVNIFKSYFLILENLYDVIIIPDARFQNELCPIPLLKTKTVNLLIKRPSLQSALTEEQKNHLSETEWKGTVFEPQNTIINETIEDLDKRANEITERIKKLTRLSIYPNITIRTLGNDLSNVDN